MCKVLFLHGNVFLRGAGNAVKLLLQHVFRRPQPFYRPNAAPCRLFAAQMQLRAVLLQPKRRRPPSFCKV